MSQQQERRRVAPHRDGTQEYGTRHAEYEASRDAERQEKARKSGDIAVEQVAEIDEILADIDSILEENTLIALEYRQQGGQAILPISVVPVMALETHRLVIFGVEIVPTYIGPIILAVLATIYAVNRFAPNFSKKCMRSSVCLSIKMCVSKLLFARVKLSYLGASLRTVIMSFLDMLFDTASKTLFKFVRVFTVSVKINIFLPLLPSMTRKMRAIFASRSYLDATFSTNTKIHSTILPQKGGE